MSTTTQLSQSDINHLRRLLGYVRCEIGQEPEEMVSMVRGLLPHVEPVSDDGKERLVKAYQKSERVPKYIRAAVEALEKVVRDDGTEEPAMTGEVEELVTARLTE